LIIGGQFEFTDASTLKESAAHPEVEAVGATYEEDPFSLRLVNHRISKKIKTKIKRTRQSIVAIGLFAL
jgi:hypothetical protein